MARRGIPFGKRPGAGETPSAEPSRPKRPVALGVREAIDLANRALERGFRALWIEGEVSNLNLPRSGHAYFTLKDATAALPVAMWATNVRRLRFRLVEGQRLRVFGRLGIYEAQGKFQLYGDRAEPSGLGELALELEQLKQRLAADGLFASDRKRPLPPWPRRIGVVTSPTGAAIHDILEVVRRRMPTSVLLAPAKVQGAEAAWQLRQALRRLAAIDDIELIILGRGGGSAEDLSAFNDEALAREVAACPIPVIAAVGHEVDVSVCDLVADRRAATPSQAAEIAVPDRRALLERLGDRQRRLERGVELATVGVGARLQAAATRLERWGTGLVRTQRATIEAAHRAMQVEVRATLRRQRARQRALAERLAAVHPRARLAEDRRRLHELERRLVRAGKGLTAGLRPRLARAAGKLDALSPLAVLARGYALVRDEDGRVVRSATQVDTGDHLALRLERGTVEVEVLSTQVDDA